MNYKRKRIFILTSLMLVILSISSCTEKEEQKNALLLTYSNQLEILDNSMNEYEKNYLHQKYGDSVGVIYDSRGNIRMNYHGSGMHGMEYIFYDASKHINYAKWKNIETVFYYDVSKNEFNLDSTSRTKTSNGFILKYYSQNPSDTNGIIQEFHFISDSLIVDGYLYQDFKDFSFGEIIEDAGLLPIKTILTSEGTQKTKSLIRAKYITDPRESYFELNKEIPSKEL